MASIPIERRLEHDLGVAVDDGKDDGGGYLVAPVAADPIGIHGRRFMTPGTDTPSDEADWLLYNKQELAMVFPVATLRGLLTIPRFMYRQPEAERDPNIDNTAPEDAISVIQSLEIPGKPRWKGREFAWTWNMDYWRTQAPVQERSMIAFALQSKSDLARAFFRLHLYAGRNQYWNFTKADFDATRVQFPRADKAVEHTWNTLIKARDIPDLFALGARAFLISTEFVRMKHQKLYSWLIFYFPLGATNRVVAFRVSPTFITLKTGVLPPRVTAGHQAELDASDRWARDLTRDVKHASHAWKIFIRDSAGYDPLVDDTIAEIASFTKPVAGHFKPGIDVIYVQFRKLEEAPAPYQNDSTVRLALTVADRTPSADHSYVKRGSVGDWYLRFRLTGDSGRTQPQTVDIEEGKVGDTPRSIMYSDTTTYEARSPREFLKLLSYVEARWRNLGPSVRAAARAMTAVVNADPHTDLYRKGLRVVATLKDYTLFIRLAIVGPNGENEVGVWGNQDELAFIADLSDPEVIIEWADAGPETLNNMEPTAENRQRKAKDQAKGLERVFVEAERTVQLVDRLKDEVRHDTYRGLSKSPIPLDLIPKVNAFVVGK